MDISKVLEAVNEALSAKDLTIWLQKDEITTLKAEIEKLKEKNEKLTTGIEELKNKKDW